MGSRAEWDELGRLGDAALIERLGMEWHPEAKKLNATDLENSNRIAVVLKFLIKVLEGLG